MDFVGYPLKEAEHEFQQNRIEYRCITTHPSTNPKNGFHLDADCLFVVRQHVDDGGVYHLVVAAKMGKEVFSNGLQD